MNLKSEQNIGVELSSLQFSECLQLVKWMLQLVVIGSYIKDNIKLIIAIYELGSRISHTISGHTVSNIARTTFVLKCIQLNHSANWTRYCCINIQLLDTTRTAFECILWTCIIVIFPCSILCLKLSGMHVRLIQFWQSLKPYQYYPNSSGIK